jgi:hypothetical protein
MKKKKEKGIAEETKQFGYEAATATAEEEAAATT